MPQAEGESEAGRVWAGSGAGGAVIRMCVSMFLVTIHQPDSTGMYPHLPRPAEAQQGVPPGK